jgi:hypothetical protein
MVPTTLDPIRDDSRHDQPYVDGEMTKNMLEVSAEIKDPGNGIGSLEQFAICPCGPHEYLPCDGDGIGYLQMEAINFHREFLFTFTKNSIPISRCRPELYSDSISQETMAYIKRLIHHLEHERDVQILRKKEIHSLCNMAFQDEPFCHVRSAMSWKDFEPCVVKDDCNAILIARYHPDSKKRTEIHFNRAFADLVGVPHEEARRRFAEYGPCLPMPIQDCLYALVDDILNQYEEQLERYFRLCCINQSPDSARLVAGTQLKSFDSVGQVVQARLPHSLYEGRLLG